MVRKARGRSPHTPPKIDSIIKSSFKALGIEARVRESAIKKMWPELVGEAIAKNASPMKLMGKTLYVAVSTSPWMTELNYSKRLIVEKVNERVGTGSVTDIVLKLGSVSPPPVGGKVKGVEERALTREDELFIEETTSRIKDEAIRSTIKKALEKSRKAGSF